VLLKTQRDGSYQSCTSVCLTEINTLNAVCELCTRQAQRKDFCLWK